MTNHERTVAVLGLGRLGSAMARRLAGSGFPVAGWSRGGGTVEGVHPAADPREAVQDAAVVLVALYDAAACRAVLAECLAATRHDCVIVNTATVSPAEAIELRALAQGHARRYLHCPVLGSAPAAREGALTLLAGHPGASEHVLDVLGTLGRVVRFPDIGAAASMKLLANGLLADCMTSLGRALARARRLELDVTRTLDVLERSPLGGLVTAKRARIEGSGGAADFTAGALAKDLDLLATIDPPSAGLAGTVRDNTVAEDADIAAITTELAESGSRPLDAASRLYAAAGVCRDSDLLAPLISYARGHATGEPNYFRGAFRPTAHIEGIRGGEFVSWDVDSYCGNFTGRPAADEGSRVRTLTELQRLDTVASATMILEHRQDTFTDAFLLVKDGSTWQIANKVYHRSTLR